MERPSFWKYLHLKLMATVFRLLICWKQSRQMKYDLPLSKDVGRTPIEIPSREKGRFIKAWTYHPPGQSTSAQVSKKPILINWHGSGFVIPSLGTDRPFCARVARETGVVVLDADYRKGPEDPFPAAVHDVEDVLRWVTSYPEKYDLNHVSVSGFSAGGNLALVAASSVAKTVPSIRITSVIAIYPPTDLSIAPEAKTVPEPINPIPVSMSRIFNDCYVFDRTVRRDPRVSPALADPASFPGAVAILTCGGDPLSPESNALAAKLDNGQRVVVNITLKGVGHAFDKGCKKGSIEWEQREIAYSAAIKTIKAGLGWE